jgi:hypothetical protein
METLIAEALAKINPADSQASSAQETKLIGILRNFSGESSILPMSMQE